MLNKIYIKAPIEGSEDILENTIICLPCLSPRKIIIMKHKTGETIKSEEILSEI